MSVRQNTRSITARHVGRGALTVLGLPTMPEWMAEGLCAQVDMDLHFPEKGGSTADAKRICRACPVRAECLQYALEHDERYGVWGGVSERERRKLARPRVVGNQLRVTDAESRCDRGDAVA